MPTQIVDIHPHVISEDIDRYPMAPLDGKRPAWTTERHMTFEQMMAAMDEAGVDKAALVHTSTYGYDNSYVADCVAARPDRFTAVFSVDVTAPGVIEQIRHWYDRGLSGLRILAARGTSNGQAESVSFETSFAAMECCEELGIPVCVQLPPRGIPRLMAPPLKVLVERFPNVKIVLDHLLKPLVEEGPPYAGSQFLFDLARYKNVYLKLSTNNIRAVHNAKARGEAFLPRLIQEFGASRIAWGSNCPASKGTLVEMVYEAKAALAGLSEEDRHWILCRTAQTLYPALKDV